MSPIATRNDDPQNDQAGPVAKVGKTAMMSLALRAASHAKDRLDEILKEVRFTRQYITGRKHYVLPIVGTAKTTKTEIKAIEEVPQGQTFIGRRLTAQGPEEAQLELYKNNVSPDNFLEVVANIQVYANNCPGDLIVEGPATIIAVVTKAKAEGNVSINLSGYLIPTVLHAFKG
jgi:hypothetical protein